MREWGGERRVKDSSHKSGYISLPRKGPPSSFPCTTGSESESENHSVLPDSVSQAILQARILEWVAFPFSRGSSQPGDQAQVSRIAGGFFTN